MTPKDNSKLTLFAYSDWLEENNHLELAEEIRWEINKHSADENLYSGYGRGSVRHVGSGQRGCGTCYHNNPVGGCTNYVGGTQGETLADYLMREIGE